MNLTEWAHAQGIYMETACRWYREGTLPVPVQKVGRLILMSPGTATQAARKTEGAGLYAQVSSHGQKFGLDGQVAGLSTWATEAGLSVVRGEVWAASGVNGLQPKVRSLPSDPVGTVVVAGHPERFGRVNTELAVAALSAHSSCVVVPGNSDQVGDVVELQGSGGAV